MSKKDGHILHTARTSNAIHQSPVFRVRKPRGLVRLLLFVWSAGRCEFDGCNDYLMEHHVTLTEGNFGEMAHIVAFSEDGPRGDENGRPVNINNVDNLMLLCPRCHKLIDDHPDDYTRRALEGYKAAHETRIRHITALGQDRKTVVVVFKALIDDQTVSVPFDQIVEATAPRYPSALHPMTIDLTPISGSDTAFLNTACATIKRRVGELFTPENEAMRIGHISIFALAPIPLLVYLGRQLTNKVPNDIYQRHRDTETWTWKVTGRSVRYMARNLKQGGRRKVVIVLSLSGKIRLRDLPDESKRSATIYEITLRDQVPCSTFLRMKQDLDGFRIAYQELLAQIIQHHGVIDSIDLFPAVPAPIAILCGRELLSKVHPKLRVFDYDRHKGGFNFKLEV